MFKASLFEDQIKCRLKFLGRKLNTQLSNSTAENLEALTAVICSKKVS